MDHHGGPELLPPGTGVTFTGALDRGVEEAVKDRKLLGLITQMAPQLVLWAEVLCQLDQMFLLALKENEGGWLECV